MSMQEGSASDQNADMTAGDESGRFSEQAVANMAADPALQDIIFSLQDEACATLSGIIDRTAAILMQDVERSQDKSDDSPRSPQRPILLAGAESTRRRQAWQKARELAEMLVIGALLNKDNPAWDPADPSSCAEGGQGALLSLIRFEPEDEDADSAPEG